MDREGRSRRRYLRTLGAGIAVGIAGCTAPITRQLGRGSDTDSPTTGGSASSASQSPSTPRLDTPDPRSEATDDDVGVYTRVYRQTIDSVVLVRTFGELGTPGQGSGFVYDDGGHVVTNQHVVADASSIEIRFSRGEWRTATVVGTDIYSDLAVLRIPDVPGYVAPLSLIRTHPIIGQEVVVIGSPFGLEKSLSTGVVSGINRSIPTRGGFTIPDAVQTDAPVNPGNSGGPLVTLDGTVVGVIRSAGGDNIGFAISAALLRRVVSALIETGRYRHAYMGVALTTVTPTTAQANDLESPSGVLVVDVLSDGPSSDVLQPSDRDATVKGVTVPVGGDIIIGMGGQRIRTQEELATFLALETSPGDTIDVTVIRDGSRQRVELTLGARPRP